ncbi:MULTISPECIES: DUF4189 domain-containing protein [Neisseria]|mgnify:FL=1|uniref:DUF4189 domain-containing protein n=1 Tax=Neisseria TaxID=482 RepID=UPI0008A96D15|nr:DUF4189 domain-containing protein [Neisseria sp. HMSC064D07]OHQ08050.1 hypothetical protein HMPREF2608_05740 [Neisseria sp. HMSC064D07]
MKKLLFILLGLTSLNIYANGCGGEYQPATGTCRIIDSSGRQILYNVGKPQSSNNSSAQTKVINIDIPSKYLAWAINLKTGVSAGAMDMDSLEAAKKLAIKTCEQGGKNAPCIVAKWVRNGCLAVAQGKYKGKWKTFYGVDDPGRSETNALNQCNKATGVTQCRITTSEGCALPHF